MEREAPNLEQNYLGLRPSFPSLCGQGWSREAWLLGCTSARVVSGGVEVAADRCGGGHALENGKVVDAPLPDMDGWLAICVLERHLLLSRKHSLS